MPELSPECWMPHIKLETCLASIQHLLANPDLDPRYSSSMLNKAAYDQYFENRDKYNKTSKEWITNSSEGCGKVKFEDYRVASIQSILSIPGIINYKCSIYCQRKASHTWTLTLLIVPDVAVYQQPAIEYIGKFHTHAQKLTSFEFDFKEKEITIGIPTNGISKDECWGVKAIGKLLVKKEECDADPRKKSPTTCELSLEWLRTEIKPRRLIEKITLNRLNSEIIYSVDVSVDPSNFESWTHNLSIQSCFTKLLPLAASWENIGCLLNIPVGRLRMIRYNESSADNCL